MSPRAETASFTHTISPEYIRQHHCVRCQCAPRSSGSVRKEEGAVRNRMQAEAVISCKGKSPSDLSTSLPTLGQEESKILLAWMNFIFPKLAHQPPGVLTNSGCRPWLWPADQDLQPGAPQAGIRIRNRRLWAGSLVLHPFPLRTQRGGGGLSPRGRGRRGSRDGLCRSERTPWRARRDARSG